jgi:hypothetical protein
MKLEDDKSSKQILHKYSKIDIIPRLYYYRYAKHSYNKQII